MNKKMIIIILGISVLLALLVGSLFILKNGEGVLYSDLVSNSLFGTVSAQVEEIIEKESNLETTITRSTETTCNNGTCNLVLYSGIRFVEEDNQWKKVENARSLKGKGFNIVLLEDDGTHQVNVIDFNITYIEFNFSYDKDNLGEFELEIEDGKMKTKYKIVETLFNETTGEPYDVEIEQEIEIEEGEQKNIIYHGNPFGKEFKLGENSTTIMLQEPDTEVLDDSAPQASSPDRCEGLGVGQFLDARANPTRIYIKFNISSVPSGSNILNATFFQNIIDAPSVSQTVAIHHGLNHTWIEDSVNNPCAPSFPTGMTWNSQMCGSSFTSFNDSSQCNLTAESIVPSGTTDGVWLEYQVTQAVTREFNENNLNVTFAERLLEENTGTFFPRFHTKESVTPSLRPFLNITFDAPAPIVNLNSPANNTFSNVLNQFFNSSYSAPGGNLVNATLSIWNSTLSLVFNQTDLVTGSSNSSSINFTFTTDDIYVWNYEVCDDSVLCAFNETNFTLTIDTVPPTFDNLANISVDANTSFSFDINATDALSPISCFTVNDTVNFQIDCDGVLQNNTVLAVEVFALNISVNDSANNTAFGTMSVNVTVFDTILKWDWAALMTDFFSPDQICFIFRGDREYCIDSSTITGRWNLSGTNLFPSVLNSNVGINTSTPQNTLNVVGDLNVTGNFTTSTGGTIEGNETCMFLSSPDGTSRLEICDS